MDTTRAQKKTLMKEVVIRNYGTADREACMNIFRGNVPRFFTHEEVAEFEIWLNGQDDERLAYGNTKAEYYYVAESENKIIACGGFYIAREESTARMA
ncbi:MAG: hypothetical protein M3R17_00180 [Bacteroidota bacterium]|nr:hypothetical protein [Bacteroidota bacterium]